MARKTIQLPDTGNEEEEMVLERNKNPGFGSFVLFFKLLKLPYNVGLVSVVQQSDSVIHTYTFFFKIYLSIMVYPRRLDRVPCAISRTSLSTHSKCNRLPLLPPLPQSIPLPLFSPLATTSCLLVCGSCR